MIMKEKILESFLKINEKKACILFSICVIIILACCAVCYREPFYQGHACKKNRKKVIRKRK